MGNWVWSDYIPIPRFHPITMGKTCGIKIKPHVHSSKTNLLHDIRSEGKLVYTQLSGHLGRYSFIRQVLGNIKANFSSHLTHTFDFVFHYPLVAVECDFKFFHFAHDFLY